MGLLLLFFINSYRKVDLILPNEFYEVVWNQCTKKIVPVEYFRVNMRLGDLFRGEFWNTYLRSGMFFNSQQRRGCCFVNHVLIGIGDIGMLSEGRPGIDPIYSVQDG